ncbi:hypothetical protein BDW22DRAFT_1429735 [Trametopsis cervina]|nr:hypothetical protein BDW22DRAFT_1429735 [Trametopsis cervina]
MSSVFRVFPTGKDKAHNNLDPSSKRIAEFTLGGEDGTPSSESLKPGLTWAHIPGVWPRIVAPLRHIVWAELAEGNLKLSALARKRQKQKLSLVHVGGKVPEDKREAADAFVAAVMERSHKGVKRGRHLLVLVNPKAGPGKSVPLYHKRIEPVFKAAHCTTDVIYTTHFQHGIDIAKNIPLGKYDAIATVSGDGLVFETINGLAAQEDPIRALRIPIAPIPTGSGNALALNLLGLEEGSDISAAALNAAKGASMAADVFSVTQGDKRVLSFLSQSVGLMCDIDLGTDNLRFLGSSRFVYGFFRGVIKHNKCPVKVSIKVVEADKHRMVERLHAAREESKLRKQPHESASGNDSAIATGPSLPPLSHKDEPTGEGWITLDKPVLFLYAGKGPYVSRDLMQFPASHADDGLIDVVVQEMIPRTQMLSMMEGADAGQTFWTEEQRYYKAEAYRVETHAPNNYLSVDGEPFPFEPYQVEVHPKLVNWLSPYGVYQPQFIDRR